MFPTDVSANPARQMYVRQMGINFTVDFSGKFVFFTQTGKEVAIQGLKQARLL